jgi:hypothetical protein
MTKKRVTVVVNRVRRRLKKHMRLVLIVAPVNRHEEQYFTSHTYTYGEREKKTIKENEIQSRPIGHLVRWGNHKP